MAIESAPYYFAKCDNCGERCEYDDYSALADAGEAEEATLSCGWTRKGETWHCESCPPLSDASDL